MVIWIVWYVQASLGGTHPHQWCPPSVHDYYVMEGNGAFVKQKRTVEVFICHNGDLEFFDVAGVTYPTDEIMAWQERALHHPAPNKVDSAGVAGMMDIMRCQGVWFHSIRFGFLFGPRRSSLEYNMPTKQQFEDAAKIAQEVFDGVAQTLKGQDYDNIRESMKDALLSRISRQKILGLDMEGGDLVRFVNKTVDGFFDNDLLASVRSFLGNAKGSFGLCITCSLDAKRQLVVAARGQTISVAFYPGSGLVLWGSEQAAVKAALIGEKHSSKSGPAHECSRCGYSGHGHEDDGACRLDLDDLGGEVCLIDWGEGEASFSSDNTNLPRHVMMNGKVTLVIAEESTTGKQPVFKKRLVRLHQNPLIKPLPDAEKDAVGQDVADIPQILSDIQTSWDAGTSINNISSWWLGKCITKRLQHYQNGTHDGSVDILVTGCEVSLWLGEQFCSDLTQVFPRLNIKCISANKLLGLFGQDFPIPQCGHAFHEHAWNLKDTVSLIISHSGGTFGSLAVSNLLQAYTEQIFVVASESDTQVGKQLRKIHQYNVWDLKCPVFSTEVGLRPAEPCSVSVAATHQILTQILLYLMRKVQLDGLEEVSGGKYTVEDYKQLEDLNHNNIAALEEICGYTRHNKKLPTKTEKTLRDKGNYWALHVLETPMSWMCCATYVLVTFYSGYPIAFGIAQLILWLLKHEESILLQNKSVFINHRPPYEIPGYWKYLVTFLDSAIYIFLPQLTVLLLRVLTGRRLLHRMVGRSIVIGDIPWVAQCVEAYLSKLFACAYSASSISVYSGNPADHLVHRMTHRVVRGGLLACGRPDGRLMALTSAEASVCLSVNQASSILSIGATLESLTIGHNPAPLGLAPHNIFLPGCRKQFLCENVLVRTAGKKMLEGAGAGTLLGAYSNMRRMHSHAGSRKDRSEGAASSKSGAFKRGGSSGAASPTRSDFKHVQLHADVMSMDESVRSAGFADSSVHSLFSAETEALADAEKEGGEELDEHVIEVMRMMNEHDQPLRRQRTKRDLKKLLGSTHDRKKIKMDEAYYGEHLENELKDTALSRLCDEQVLAMRLYETRIASLQRCVAFFVLFHQMAKRVADFWPSVSFGYLGYETSRTHSIMRIATTASPVSGAEVRDRTIELAKIKRLKNSKNKMLACIYTRREREKKKAAAEAEKIRKREERQKLMALLSPEQRLLMESMMGDDEDDLSKGAERALMMLKAQSPDRVENNQQESDASTPSPENPPGMSGGSSSTSKGPVLLNGQHQQVEPKGTIDPQVPVGVNQVWADLNDIQLTTGVTEVSKRLDLNNISMVTASLVTIPSHPCR